MNSLNLPIGIALSGDQMLKGGIKSVVLYSDLVNMDTDEILSKLPMALLYETSSPSSNGTFGHWTMLHMVDGGLEFFDSYGFLPDKEWEKIDPKLRMPHALVEFLIKMGKTHSIHYSPYHFQERKAGVNTCGRWVLLRLKIGGNLDKFSSAVEELANQVRSTPDELVTFLIQP